MIQLICRMTIDDSWLHTRVSQEINSRAVYNIKSKAKPSVQGKYLRFSGLSYTLENIR